MIGSNPQGDTSELLLEAIKVLDNQMYNLDYHQARMQDACKAVCGVEKTFDFRHLEERIAALPSSLHKMRVAYDDKRMEVEFLPYKITPKHSLKLVFDDEIDYTYKFADRDHLKALFDSRGNCDDIVIVRNEFLTDSYYCNIALEKAGEWYTPKSPLLRGTKRQELLASGLIIEKDISLETLFHYSRLRMFNAMIGFGDIELQINQLR